MPYIHVCLDQTFFFFNLLILVFFGASAVVMNTKLFVWMGKTGGKDWNSLIHY